MNSHSIHIYQAHLNQINTWSEHISIINAIHFHFIVMILYHSYLLIRQTPRSVLQDGSKKVIHYKINMIQ